MSFHTLLDKDESRENINRTSSVVVNLSRVWYIEISIVLVYFIIVYMLPLTKIIPYPIIHYKIIIEYCICCIPILTGILLNKLQMEQKSLTFSLDKDTFFLNINNKIIGISCLEISSASGSINIDENGIPKYNASMLLAIRSGMEKGVNLVFEGGAFEGKPFLRFFINLQGHDSEIIKEILRREATRVEAVLLASLNMVDLRMLEDDELLSVIQSIIGCSISELSETKTNDFSKIILLSLRGNPRVHPIADASQIGTFISTIMKQGYSTSMSCVFSAAKPGRERRKLEGKWKTIQSKEKRKEETLKDHALKKKLIVQ